MNNTTPHEDWANIHGVLSEMMFGFDSLTAHIRGMMVGNSIATGELYETHDIETTRLVVKDVFANFVDMTNAYGIEA